MTPCSMFPLPRGVLVCEVLYIDDLSNSMITQAVKILTASGAGGGEELSAVHYPEEAG